MPKLTLTTYPIIKFRNKFEYSLTHMIIPTLVKLNMHITFTILISKTFHEEYINISQTRLSLIYPFLGSISPNSFLLKPFFKENIVPHAMTLFLYHLLSHNYPALFFCAFKNESYFSLSEKH